MADLSSSRPRSVSAGARAVVENPVFQRVVIGAILINAVALGLDTMVSVRTVAGPMLEALDRIFLAFFIAEIVLRLVAYRTAFFRSGWNLFDFAVVAVSLVPNAGPLTVARALRVLRAFRLINAVPQMRAVIAALVASLPGIGAIAAVLALMLYVSAVMATHLFGGEFPDRFGSLGMSLFTLFQLMTLDGWSAEIVKPVMDVQPWSILFFLAYILVATFAVLNLFVAIIVDSMQQLHRSGVEEAAAEAAAVEAGELRAIADQLEAIRAELKSLDERLSARSRD